MITDADRAQAQAILNAAPCSIELPAGTGKTHTLATAVALAAEQGRRSLVLTHTHAGVDAIRRRLKRFGVRSSAFRIETIASWAFTLTRSYSTLAGIQLGPEPDWTQTNAYVAGATRVAEATAIRQMLAVSFSHLLVDEYQDCTVTLHSFITALADAIPSTVALGDPLQGIFGWSEPLANWTGDVVPRFPRLSIPVVAYRWVDHNVALGSWLLGLRSRLTSGGAIDFAAEQVPGLSYLSGLGPAQVAQAAHSFTDPNESVVLLDKWPNDVADHASRLGGAYVVMEEIEGKFMKAQLRSLPAEGDPGLAAWLAGLAKQCMTGLGRIDTALTEKLARDESVMHLSRPGLEEVVAALDAVRAARTYRALRAASEQIRRAPSGRLFRWEAWHDTLSAIEMTEINGLSASTNLAVLRERLRRGGRRAHARVASRTLLVKGLEYDHVVIANLRAFNDPQNLYVALSRARKSITILGNQSRVVLR